VTALLCEDTHNAITVVVEVLKNPLYIVMRGFCLFLRDSAPFIVKNIIPKGSDQVLSSLPSGGSNHSVRPSCLNLAIEVGFGIPIGDKYLLKRGSQQRRSPPPSSN
jgi:hypothetical protein